MSTQILEEVTLNWTDLTGAKTGATSLGSNKFYRAQIFADFTVVFTYGRVGQSGQVQKVKGKDLADAKKQLQKKIDSKIAKGYDSIVARGQKEPDPKDDITFKFEGKDVVIPQGKPIAMKQYAKSSFDQSEYLVYSESQVRIRYCCQVKI